MFKTHLIQKGEVRIPPSRPEPRPAGIRPAEEGDKKSKVNKNVDKGSPEMVADHFRHHPEDRVKFLSNDDPHVKAAKKILEESGMKKAVPKYPGIVQTNEELKPDSTHAHVNSAAMRLKTGSFFTTRNGRKVSEGQEQRYDWGEGSEHIARKAMTAGATSTTGSAMMHPVADGADQKPGDMNKSKFKKSRYPEDSEDTEEDREEDEAGHVKETKHRAKTEGEEEDEDVEKSTPLDWSEKEREIQHRTGKNYVSRNAVAAEVSNQKNRGIGTEKRGDVKKNRYGVGFGTHLRGQTWKPDSKYAAAQAHARDTERSGNDRLKEHRHTQAMAGMRNLHKSMETVIKGLNSFVKALAGQ